MKPDFMDRTAKIIAEVRTRTCIDKLDTEVLEVLEEILQDELIKYHNEVLTYARSLEEAVDSAYDEGHSDGYDDGEAMGYNYGYADGRESGLEDGRAEAEYNNEAYYKDAVEIAYGEGYALGYSDGTNADF